MAELCGPAWVAQQRARCSEHSDDARSLAFNVERIDSTAAVAPAEPSADLDQSPLTTKDVQRLLAAVSAELDQFAERMSAVVDHPVQAQSGGGHVQGSARRGQVLSLDVDAGWAGQAPHRDRERTA
jgi:hypothetical protein